MRNTTVCQRTRTSSIKITLDSENVLSKALCLSTHFLKENTLIISQRGNAWRKPQIKPPVFTGTICLSNLQIGNVSDF